MDDFKVICALLVVSTFLSEVFDIHILTLGRRKHPTWK